MVSLEHTLTISSLMSPDTCVSNNFLSNALSRSPDELPTVVPSLDATFVTAAGLYVHDVLHTSTCEYKKLIRRQYYASLKMNTRCKVRFCS